MGTGGRLEAPSNRIIYATVSRRTFIPKGDIDEHEDLEFVPRA